jgi:hypothetical protein
MTWSERDWDDSADDSDDEGYASPSSGGGNGGGGGGGSSWLKRKPQSAAAGAGGGTQAGGGNNGSSASNSWNWTEKIVGKGAVAKSPRGSPLPQSGDNDGSGRRAVSQASQGQAGEGAK